MTQQICHLHTADMTFDMACSAIDSNARHVLANARAWQPPLQNGRIPYVNSEQASITRILATQAVHSPASNLDINSSTRQLNPHIVCQGLVHP